MKDVIERAIDQVVEARTPNPRTVYMHEVLDALGYEGRHVDPTSSGYRVKLWSNRFRVTWPHSNTSYEGATDAQRSAFGQAIVRKNQLDIARLKRKLEKLGYADVQVVLRGMDDYISLIVPYFKEK
jgi:hypothetical protein